MEFLDNFLNNPTSTIYVIIIIALVGYIFNNQRREIKGNKIMIEALEEKVQLLEVSDAKKTSTIEFVKDLLKANHLSVLSAIDAFKTIIPNEVELCVNRKIKEG